MSEISAQNNSRRKSLDISMQYEDLKEKGQMELSDDIIEVGVWILWMKGPKNQLEFNKKIQALQFIFSWITLISQATMLYYLQLFLLENRKLDHEHLYDLTGPIIVSIVVMMLMICTDQFKKLLSLLLVIDMLKRGNEIGSSVSMQQLSN